MLSRELTLCLSSHRVTQLGDFYCGTDLVYARKLTM
jgi:hypothetical protein